MTVKISSLVAASLIVLGCGRTTAPTPDPWREARDFVTVSLRDPASAQFGAFTRGKGKSVCGWINSKNGFGGFTGMEAFVYTPDATDRLYIYEFHGPLGDWDKRGEMAEVFEARGCSVGPDHERALQATQAIRESNHRLGLDH